MEEIYAHKKGSVESIITKLKAMSSSTAKPVAASVVSVISGAGLGITERSLPHVAATRQDVSLDHTTQH